MNVQIRSLLKKCNSYQTLKFYSVHLPTAPAATIRTKNWHLSHRNTGTRREIDQLGTWNFIDQESSIKRGTPIPLLSKNYVGKYSDRGRRTYQEDRYTICEPLPNLLAIGIWDGHGGPEAADFCANHFEKFFLHKVSRQESPESANLEEALKDTLLDLDVGFRRHWNKSKVPSPGTTATVALIRGGYELCIGHIGDSIALLSRDKKPKKLTRDHDPSDSQERLRIEEAGGEVIADAQDTLRVNGRLNMTRSIGDIELKEFGVIALPETSRRSLKHGKDNFLILLSDGVATALNFEEIVNIAHSCDSPQAAASRIVDQAIYGGCEDNATALIMPFGKWKNESDQSSGDQSFGRNLTLSPRFM